jgi:CheY-like chemotaxis protein/Tfp pilus assembly protein PilZ
MSFVSPLPLSGSPAPGRGAARPPILELRYRSLGSFLCAYSSRMARGEVFVETERPLDLGTRLTLRIIVPGVAPLHLEAKIGWTRGLALGPGQPAGMGIGLTSSIEAHGAVIDDIASRYAGIRILVVGGTEASRAVLARYLKSILACDVVEKPLPLELGAALVPDEQVDLAVVDLDGEREDAITAIRTLRSRPVTADLPVIALAQLERDRIRAATLGVSEVLATPPLFTEVQAAVVHAISAPLTSPGPGSGGAAGSPISERWVRTERMLPDPQADAEPDPTKS